MELHVDLPRVMTSKRVSFQNAPEIFDAEVCHVKVGLGNDCHTPCFPLPLVDPP
jgi:hypothetical protein